MADSINKFKKNTLKEEEKEVFTSESTTVKNKKKIEKKEIQDEITPNKKNYFFKDERLHKVVGLFHLFFHCIFFLHLFLIC